MQTQLLLPPMLPTASGAGGGGQEEVLPAELEEGEMQPATKEPTQ